MAIQATAGNKTVADPCSAYESIRPIWSKNRAVCGGERLVKEFDGFLDTIKFTNLLIPFSPSMTPEQYSFYKAEAELPGIVALYSKFIVGGLLRKQPHLEFDEEVNDDIKGWILDSFTQDSMPLSTFLHDVLNEEIQTARAWIYIDYPKVVNPEELTQADFLKYKPYPILWKAEEVVNWRVSKNPETGLNFLDRVFVRTLRETFDDDNEFHPKLKDTVHLHEIVDGYYQIRVFEFKAPASAMVVNGKIQENKTTNNGKFELVETIQNIKMNGERLTFIPAWPVNGNIDLSEPLLTPLVDREVSLYNKMSRRNHLLYGASTYTPVIASNIEDEKFQEIVESGLGTWIHLNQGDTASVLDTPTSALVDMDRAIAATIEDMAKMGVRMLSPESAESGIALEIRNAAQTATLGSLNTRISNTFCNIIAFMISWRYGTELTARDITFSLSADFNPSPLGADWLRLCTEWYQEGLIPRAVWLQILKQNDIVPSDYDDKTAIQEINEDEFIMPNTPGRMETNASLEGRAEKLRVKESGMEKAINDS